MGGPIKSFASEKIYGWNCAVGRLIWESGGEGLEGLEVEKKVSKEALVSPQGRGSERMPWGDRHSSAGEMEMPETQWEQSSLCRCCCHF